MLKPLLKSDEVTIQSCPSGAMVAQPTCNRQVTGSNPVSGFILEGTHSKPKVADQYRQKLNLSNGWYWKQFVNTLQLRRRRAANPELLNHGGVGEWLKPPDCKSGARKGYAGSNPAPSTK